MTIYYARYSANWDNAPGGHSPDTIWNDAADGSGSWGTPGAGDTANLNGYNVVLNLDVTVALITAATGTLTPSGTRVVNAPVTYSGTSTSGMVIVATGTATTINGGGAGTTAVTSSNTGYAIVSAGTGAVSITNIGGTGVLVSAAGRGVYMVGSGALSINVGAGNLAINKSGGSAENGVYNQSSSTLHSITGNISISGTTGLYTSGYTCNSASGVLAFTGNAIATSSWALNVYQGIVNFSGSASSTLPGVAILVNNENGVLNWLGAATLSASAECRIDMSAGVTNLATAADHLALSNSGTFLFLKTGGTLNTAATGAHNTAASIVNQSASSTGGCCAAIIGGTDAHKSIITGPVLPTAAQTVYTGTASYGYAGALYDGTYYGPNLDANPGVVTADAVLTTAHFGVENATAGTAAAGGGTFMPRPIQVGV